MSFNFAEYKKHRENIKPIVNLWFKRCYIVAFNAYAWFWIVRQIFFRQSTEFEGYLLWFFTTAGMYYFVLDNNDVFFKIPPSNKQK